MHFLILVTVGSSEFEFNRLLEIIDLLCENNIMEKNDIIAQTGYSSYIPKNFKNFKMMEKSQFSEYIKKADVIITHAGVGTIISSLKSEKKVIVFPRLQQYNEHVDNHQLEISKSFEDANYIKVAQNYEELKNIICNIDNFYPEKFVSNNEQMNLLVLDVIEKI